MGCDEGLHDFDQRSGMFTKTQVCRKCGHESSELNGLGVAASCTALFAAPFLMLLGGSLLGLSEGEPQSGPPDVGLFEGYEPWPVSRSYYRDPMAG